MPTIGENVNFAKLTLEQYNASTKDVNTIYFTKDTNQIFVGDQEYTIADAMSASQENILTGKIDAVSGHITVDVPKNANDAANKKYVDESVSTASTKWTVYE